MVVLPALDVPLRKTILPGCAPCSGITHILQYPFQYAFPLPPRVRAVDAHLVGAGLHYVTVLALQTQAYGFGDYPLFGGLHYEVGGEGAYALYTCGYRQPLE